MGLSVREAQQLHKLAAYEKRTETERQERRRLVELLIDYGLTEYPTLPAPRAPSSMAPSPSMAIVRYGDWGYARRVEPPYAWRSTLFKRFHDGERAKRLRDRDAR